MGELYYTSTAVMKPGEVGTVPVALHFSLSNWKIYKLLYVSYKLLSDLFLNAFL